MIKSKLKVVSWSEENKKSCKYNISKNIIHHNHDWIRKFSEVAQFLLTVDIVIKYKNVFDTTSTTNLLIQIPIG